MAMFVLVLVVTHQKKKRLFDVYKTFGASRTCSVKQVKSKK